MVVPGEAGSFPALGVLPAPPQSCLVPGPAEARVSGGHRQG